MHPELSFQEYETSKFIKSILNKWGISFQENIADTGIVVLLEGKNPEKKCSAKHPPERGGIIAARQQSVRI